MVAVFVNELPQLFPRHVAEEPMSEVILVKIFVLMDQ